MCLRVDGGSKATICICNNVNRNPMEIMKVSDVLRRHKCPVIVTEVWL